MATFEIVGKTRLINAFNRVEKEIKLQRRKIIANSAQTYQVLLIGNIFSQKYADATWEYNKDYKKWKNKNHPNKGYWNLTGDLVNAISIVRSGFSAEVGIMPNQYSSRNSANIGQYALKMEYGGKKHNQPARPVFAPTFNDFYDNEFQVVIDKAVSSIVSKWY